ncbi:hypothetical protein [Aureimonas sp. D3]|uniref:hypothetical protein n=1 Tax=Aureimonas sp. D3 TaxID=1638164 RepID=UPI000785E508|nr:hypothetical protein [Aureimonas sp. D3]
MTIRLNACLECGCDLAPGPKDREFCCAGHRATWNNRRLQRGAALYDLWMAHRWQRSEAQAAGLFQALCRLVSDYRAEDRAEREGRRSWRRHELVLGDRPHLKAKKFNVRGGR